MNKKPIVVVGMSGGIDSSFITYLLKDMGYHVIGLFMQNWDSYVNNELNYDSQTKTGCDVSADFNEAKKIADMLNIELHFVDFIEDYWENVFSYFIDELKKNRTPNPDILCNRKIKFDKFLKYATKKFKADYIAMGHYAGIIHTRNKQYLLMHGDENKDQTYFLCYLTQKQLKKSLFPIYGYNKDDVRKITKKLNFPNKEKKDSTGICFIGERKMQSFLSNYLPNQPGLIKQFETNKVVGNHIGLMYYTIGQRKGLNCGGLLERHFVADKDLKENVLWVAGESLEEKYLACDQAIITNINWISEIDFDQPLYARFRHRQKLQKINNIVIKNDSAIISFDKQKNITIGQFAVFYQPPFCLGGGQIDKTNANNKKLDF